MYQGHYSGTMGNVQSGAVKAKLPTTGTLPPPPSPFIASAPTTDTHDDMVQSVMRRLISAMSTASLSPSSPFRRLPANMLLLLALYGSNKLESGKMDVRVVFSESEFAKAFGGFAGLREEMMAMADVVEMAQRWKDNVDGEYYVLARLMAMRDAHQLLNSILSSTLEGFKVEPGRDEILLRLSVADALRMVLQAAVNAVDNNVAPFWLVGVHKKFDFVCGVLTRLSHYYDHFKSVKKCHISVDDFEVSSFDAFLMVSKHLYTQKAWKECHQMVTDIHDFYDRNSMAVLPLSQLSFLQCLCAINLNDCQSAIAYSASLEEYLIDLLPFMNQLSVNGSVLEEYQNNLQHFYYYLMCTAVNVKNVPLIVHFARLAGSNEDTLLNNLITTMAFVTLLEDEQWLEAYSSILRVPNAESRRDCIKRFLSVLLEQPDHRHVGQVLCSLPLCEHYSLVEETLLWKAKMSIEKSNFLHKLLFTFYMNHGDYRGAAGAMFRLAVSSEADLRQRYLLLTVTCLELITSEFQWIAMAEEDETAGGRRLCMYSIDDIRLMMCDVGDDASVRVYDAQSAIAFARPFVHRNDDTGLLSHLSTLDHSLQLAIYRAFPDCSWLQSYWSTRHVNEYLLYNPSQSDSILQNHISMWKRYHETSRQSVTSSRPKDLLTASLFDGTKLKGQYYDDYLPLLV